MKDVTTKNLVPMMLSFQFNNNDAKSIKRCD